MNTYSLTHLSDRVLLRDLAELVASDRAITAALLAHIAEVDARRLYLPAAYPSMFAYCVQELRLSEDAACVRIRVARVAREHPGVFAALADGRLSLSALAQLAPYLGEGNASGLLAAAERKNRAEIKQLLAERFPRSDVFAWIQPLQPELSSVPKPVDSFTPEPELSSVRARIDALSQSSGMSPLAARSFALQCTIGEETHAKLRHAQALLRHKIPSGGLAEVLDEALDALIASLEKRKFAATDRPRPDQGAPREGSRHIPAEVKRAVWQRDGGQCAFVSPEGRRCEERATLEFDHVEAFAQGGHATLEGVRLLCRAHNQHAAECTFGVGFMQQKRERARRLASQKRAREEAAARENEIVPWLRALGFRADEARRAVASWNGALEAPLEERVRHAVSCATPGPARHPGFTSTSRDGP